MFTLFFCTGLCHSLNDGITAIAVMIVEKRVSVYGTPRIVLPLLVVLMPVCFLLLPSGVVWYSGVFLSGLEEDLGTKVVFWFHVVFTFT